MQYFLTNFVVIVQVLITGFCSVNGKPILDFENDNLLKIYYQSQPVRTFLLKAMDTIGNCQRLAFTVGVSQHIDKITNL